MRLPEAYRAYTQVSKTFRRPSRPGKYENAAIQRQNRNMETKPRELINLEKPAANYPIYQGNYNRNIFAHKLTDLSLQMILQEDQQKEKALMFQRKEPESIQVYRQICDLFSMPTLESIEVLIRGGDMIKINVNNYEELVGYYKKRREEHTKNHERELWLDFNPDSMIYFDKPGITKEISSFLTGQVINLTI